MIAILSFFLIIYTCRKLDYKIYIVRLDLGLMRSLVSHYSAASVTTVYDYVPLFGIGLCSYRTENTSALIGSVTGIYIHVQGA